MLAVSAHIVCSNTKLVRSKTNEDSQVKMFVWNRQNNFAL